MFNKKTWEDRVSEFPTKRNITNLSTSESVLCTITRAEGQVAKEGDAFSAQNMNDLEDRIEAECNKIEQAIARQQDGTIVTGTKYNVGDYMVYNGNLYKVTREIPVGSSPTVNSNIVQTSVGAELKALLGNITTVSGNINSLSSSINTRLTYLDNRIEYVNNIRPRGKLVTFGREVSFANGYSHITVDCSDVLPQGFRASAVTANIGWGGGQAGEYLVASLTQADRTQVGIALHTVINTSYNGTFQEIGVVIWGNQA